MNAIKHYDFFIETDFKVDPEFWTPYFNEKWEDSNALYSNYLDNATGGKPMNKFFVQEILDFDRNLFRMIKTIWNHLGVRPNEFRCNFFRVLEGGELPKHVDQKSKSSIVIPITKNTGALYFEDDNNYDSIIYDSMVILNTLKPHGVKSPLTDRIVFHMGLHDIYFETIVENLFAKEKAIL